MTDRSLAGAAHLLATGVQAAVTTLSLRAHGVSCGAARSNGRLPRIQNGRSITLGSRVGFGGRQASVDLGAAPGGRLVIGDRCYVNQGVTLWAQRSVTIGSHVFLGDFCAVYDTSFHELQPGEEVEVAPVTICDDVWLGRLVTVLPGVTIGRGSVVAAHSVVTRDVPEFVVAAGSPAVVLRRLEPFPPDVHRRH